jgi:hypothetical protein
VEGVLPPPIWGRFAFVAYKKNVATIKQKRILIELWKRCNETFFQGQLKRQPRFHVFESKHRAGYFTPGGSRDHIGVNARYFYDLSFQDLVDTMTHECIHQFQSENKIPIAHDDFFSELAASLFIETV